MGIRVTISCRYCIALEVMLLFLVDFVPSTKLVLLQKNYTNSLYEPTLCRLDHFKPIRANDVVKDLGFTTRPVTDQ